MFCLRGACVRDWPEQGVGGEHQAKGKTRDDSPRTTLAGDDPQPAGVNNQVARDQGEHGRADLIEGKIWTREIVVFMGCLGDERTVVPAQKGKEHDVEPHTCHSVSRPIMKLISLILGRLKFGPVSRSGGPDRSPCPG